MSVSFRAPDGSIVTLPGPFDPVAPCPYCAPDEKCAICLGMEGLLAAAWDPVKHPRHPAGSEQGGEFAPKSTFVGLQGYERGPGKVVIEGDRPRIPTSEVFAHQYQELEVAVSDWAHLRELDPDKELVPVMALVPTQDQMSAVRIQEYVTELKEDGNLDELLDSTRVVEGDDGRLYVADGHNRVAAAIEVYGAGNLPLPVIRPEVSKPYYETPAPMFPPGEVDLGGRVKFWPKEMGAYSGFIQDAPYGPFWKAIVDQDSREEVAFWFANDSGYPHHAEMTQALDLAREGAPRLGYFSGYGQTGEEEWMSRKGLRADKRSRHADTEVDIIRRHRKDIKDANEFLEPQRRDMALAAAAAKPEELTVDAFNTAVDETIPTLDRFEPKLTRIYARAIKELGDQLAARFVRLAPDAVAAAAAPPPDWTPPTVAELLVAQEEILDKLAAEARVVQIAAFEVMVEGVLRRIGISFEVRALLTQVLLNGLGARAVEMIEGIRVPVARAIANSYLNGLSVPQTADAIQAAVDGLTKRQATMLARNDLIGLANGGSLTSARMVREKYPDVGLAYKEWLATPDERTRPTHVEAHGQRVPLETPFTVGDAHLAYPGDPTGPDAEVINCRCTLIYKAEPALTASSVVEKIQELTAAFIESQHPRDPGGEGGGQFIEKGSTAPDDRANLPWADVLSHLDEITREDVEAGKVPGIVTAELREDVAAHARDEAITLRHGGGAFLENGKLDSILIAHEAGHYVADEIQRESSTGMAIPELDPFKVDPGYDVLETGGSQGRIKIRRRSDGAEMWTYPKPVAYENPWGVNPNVEEILADTYAELLHGGQFEDPADPFVVPRLALLNRVARTAEKMGLPHKRIYRYTAEGPTKLTAAGWDESKHPRDPGGEGGGQFIPKGTTGVDEHAGLEKSEGHLLFADKWEYFVFGDDVLRAPLDAPIRADVPYRNGARFEFPVSQIESRMERGVYPFTQQTIEGLTNAQRGPFEVEKADVSAMHVDPQLQGVWHDEGELVYEADKPGLLATRDRRIDVMWKASRHTPTGEWKFWTVNTWGNPHHDTVDAKVGWHWNATARYSGAGRMSARDDDGTTPLNPELQALLDRHARTLRDAKELAEMHEAMRASAELAAAAWAEEKHPRHPKGSERGGEFAPRGRGIVADYIDADYNPEAVGATNRLGFHLLDEANALRQASKAAGEYASVDVLLKEKVMRDLDVALAHDPDWEALSRKVNRLEMKDYSASPGENAAARLIASWATTSSDADPWALQLQLAAEQEFGLTDVSDYARKAWDAEKTGMMAFPLSNALRDPWVEHYVWNEQEMAGARKFLRAQYDATQKVLADADINTVALYRGVRDVGAAHGQAREKMTLNAMSSFSTRYDTAYAFAVSGMGAGEDWKDASIIALNVPRERILAFPLTGFGCELEQEAIVLGGTEEGFRWTWHKQLQRPPGEPLTLMDPQVAGRPPFDHSKYLQAWDKA